ncbi:MAG TPA: DUF2306 domain-containing protein [Gemmatimonadales bacterium]|jgi:hypothetical protein|nr:DUF2306 domain-containing protein [Gemmatimonadales bacterium]
MRAVGRLAGLTVALLVAVGLTAAAGRAYALVTGAEPFAAVYTLFPPGAIEDARAVERWFAAHATLTWAHIIPGSVFLGLAPLQFARGLRENHPALHRWAGRVLLLTALPTGLTGILLQLRSPYGGALALSSILVAGGLFLGAAVLAYQAIRRRDRERHREWMIRMLAVGLGVGTVRVIAAPLILLTGQRPLELMGVAFWLGFALPVAGGEWWIRVTRPHPRTARATTAESG